MKPTVLSSDGIRRLFEEANADPVCAGLIVWMHIFLPSKMWISGLTINRKPILHLHTQYNRDIPWADIDMDFMNLNQSAHGDRGHGFIHARMRLSRKIVVGHWEDPAVRRKIGDWMRAAAAVSDGQRYTVVRWVDNMRDVAVTEGNKVFAQIKFGWQVNSWGIGDLAETIKSITDQEVNVLVKEYENQYTIAPEIKQNSQALQSIRDQARYEPV